MSKKQEFTIKDIKFREHVHKATARTMGGDMDSCAQEVGQIIFKNRIGLSVVKGGKYTNEEKPFDCALISLPEGEMYASVLTDPNHELNSSGVFFTGFKRFVNEEEVNKLLETVNNFGNEQDN